METRWFELMPARQQHCWVADSGSPQLQLHQSMLIEPRPHSSVANSTHAGVSKQPPMDQ
jgi:hypothetical protein